MNKKLHGLYAITDQQLMPDELFISMSESALKGGVNILQYRDKSTDRTKRKQQAEQLKLLCDKYQATFIINDDIELALHVNADGVHLGKDDVSIKLAKQQLGENKIIGISCYNQLKNAEHAVSAGADYIAFGRFFTSSVKPDAPQAHPELISDFKKNYNIPVCCIGGITTQNCAPLLDAGADMLAVISDVFSQSDITNTAKRFSQKFLT